MKQLYTDLIKNWHSRALPQMVSRDIALSRYTEDPKVKKIITVTGFRRVGKTYLLLDYAAKLGQNNCIYLNMEDERIPEHTDSLTQLTDMITELNIPPTTTLLIDEIQNIPGWSKWARRVHETTNHQLILTGSSSKLSSRELPTELRGRCLNVHVSPLNFSEFLRFKKTDLDQVTTSQGLGLLHEYLKFGGLPEIVLSDEGKKYLLLDEYYKTFVTRDIIERYNVRKEQTLSNLLKLLLNSTEYSTSKLARTLSSIDTPITRMSVAKYITYIESSYFLQSLLWHDSSTKNRIQAPRKAYFIDSFFVHNSSKFSDNTGRLMEHKVHEKLTQQVRENPSYSLYYWRNQQKYEVYFVLQHKEQTVKLIQVSYLTQQSAIPERELRNLVLASKRLNCSNLILITWDRSDTITQNNHRIKLVPLVEFLTSNPQLHK